jgi:hypothetical protein
MAGIEALPKDWVEIVEKQVVTDPYTVARRTARQAAEGLCKAALAEMRRQRTAVSELESLAGAVR